MLIKLDPPLERGIYWRGRRGVYWKEGANLTNHCCNAVVEGLYQLVYTTLQCIKYKTALPSRPSPEVIAGPDFFLEKIKSQCLV